MAQIAPAQFQFVRPDALHRLAVDDLPDGAWVRDLRGTLSVPSIADLLYLWMALLELDLSDDPDEFRWRTSVDERFSAKSAYNLFFIGREFFPYATELWSSWATLEVKIFV